MVNRAGKRRRERRIFLGFDVGRKALFGLQCRPSFHSQKKSHE
jgi:hypothetical protein